MSLVTDKEPDMAKKEVEFVDGMVINAVSAKGPSWIKQKVGIKIDTLIKQLQDAKAEGEEWFNVDICVSKQGKLYAKRNTWKPDSAKKAAS
tara:strand:+ start:147 stop:419 length:273 start_codon:yes stop_codon:yes gene_type:complete